MIGSFCDESLNFVLLVDSPLVECNVVHNDMYRKNIISLVNLKLKMRLANIIDMGHELVDMHDMDKGIHVFHSYCLFHSFLG